MFHLYGPQGRVFTGTLDQMRQLSGVSAAARVRRAPSAVSEDGAGSRGQPAAPGRMARAASAYAAAESTARHPLTRAGDVMRGPVHTVPAGATLRDAWQVLARHGVGQAPVVNALGVVVGLVGRAELLPATGFGDTPPDPARWAELMAQPVEAVMWSPVPATGVDTDLRRVAELLLHTGLPGVPVTDDDGQVLGFVSRTDLLRPLAIDPPLELWG